LAFHLLAHICTADIPMRHAPVLVTALTLCAPSFAVAQNGTADGIEALSRNDPAEAARIFGLLDAEGAPANPIARFFRAVLMETGFAAHGDTLVACGLYSFTAGSSTPLSAPALTNVERLRREDPDLAAGCDTPGDRAAGVETKAAVRCRRLSGGVQHSHADCRAASSIGR
jgi:hypothetical protein